MTRNHAVRSRSGNALLEQLEARRLLAAGSLDSTFGNGGIVHLGGSVDVSMYTTCSATQSDGKILLGGNGGGGTFNYQSNSMGEVDRLNATGQLDPSFGQNGQAELVAPPGYFNLNIFSIGVQPNGKIIVAGTAQKDSANSNLHQVLVLLRLTSGGSVDTSFGSHGFAIFKSWSGAANAMQLDPTGEILLASSSYNYDGMSVARVSRMARLTIRSGAMAGQSSDFITGIELGTNLSRNRPRRTQLPSVLMERFFSRVTLAAAPLRCA